MTKIEWTNETWNPVTGCTKKSEGCKNCYAEKMHKRLTAMGQDKYSEPFCKVVFHKEEIYRKHPKGKRMIFVNSMSDTFHDALSREDINLILTHCHLWQDNIFQILTKRAERLPDFVYPKNIWLGVTVEKAEYKTRIEHLKRTGAKIKFLSCEPLLEDLGDLDLTGIDWVIVGGESGPNARPMHPDWVRNIQQQCAKQNVAFFFKQWGEWCAGPQIDYNLIKDKFAKNIRTDNDGCILLNVECKVGFGYRLGKKYTGCLLDGKEYKEYPKVEE